MTGINDAVHWRAELGGGTTVALVQAGTFRTDSGAIFGPVPWILWRDWAQDELDANRRLLQALNCLLVETPAGRVLIETGIGERIGDKGRAMRDYRGDPVVPALRAAGFDPTTVDLVAMSHLHFDHAGGLLLADGSRAFPRARIVATGARRAGPRATASCCRACPS
jgi:glyoxylase-like metal-dependent hydrolase (beta-lactamase superfamily II)